MHNNEGSKKLNRKQRRAILKRRKELKRIAMEQCLDGIDIIKKAPFNTTIKYTDGGDSIEEAKTDDN